MQAPLSPRPLASRRGLATASLLLLLQLALGFAAVFSDHVGDHPLILMTLPVALGAVALGIRGALLMAVIASVLAGAWWVSKGQPGGIVWLGGRVGTYAAIAAVLGWALEGRAKLLRRLAAHNELSLDLVATASFDGFFTQVNPAFTRTLGFAAEELTTRPLLEFIHPDDREPTLRAIREQTEQGLSIFHFCNRYRTKDGSYRWLEWTSLPDPAAKELVAAARDITQRKSLEELERQYTHRLEREVNERTRELQQSNARLEAARRDNLHRLALAAEYRDDATHQHTERIGRAAALLAAELGLSEPEVEVLREAAPLHDIGKLAVSDSVLLKPGKLTPEEFEHVKRHAEAGASILAGAESEVLRTAEAIAWAHHEWWDGNGYPRRLAGEAIPLAARIVAVVDVFDALTHARPYKRAWSLDQALAEIRALTGRQFDPRVVEAFERLDHRALFGQEPARRLASVA